MPSLAVIYQLLPAIGGQGCGRVGRIEAERSLYVPLDGSESRTMLTFWLGADALT